MAKKRRVAGFVFGGMLILGGISGLFWNEWRSAHRIATLLEGEDQAVSAANGKVAQNHDGKLVHVSATASTAAKAVDDKFGLAQDAVRLDRRVEMYQWREKKEGSGDDRQVVYERVWAEGRINSEAFEEPSGRINPALPPIRSNRFFPTTVQLGDYTISKDVLGRIDRLSDVPPPAVAVDIEGLALAPQGNYLATGTIGAAVVGDIRVSWRQAPILDYSVLAAQMGADLRPWRASNDGEIALIEPGRLTMDAMFQEAYGDNRRTTWLARGGFTLTIFMGFTILLRRLARAIPLIGAVAAKLSKPLAAILTAATALITIAAGWLLFRPLFSLGLIVLAVVAFGALRLLRAKEPQADLAHASQPPPPPGN